MTAIQNRRYVTVAGPRMRGLGQVDPALTDPTDLGWTTTSVPGYTGVPAMPAAAGGGSTPTPINWGSILSNLITTAGKTAQVSMTPLAALPAGSYYSSSPYGTVVSTGGAATSNLLASSLTSSLSGMMPLLLIGGGLLVVVMMLKK